MGSQSVRTRAFSCPASPANAITQQALEQAFDVETMRTFISRSRHRRQKNKRIQLPMIVTSLRGGAPRYACVHSVPTPPPPIATAELRRPTTSPHNSTPISTPRVFDRLLHRINYFSDSGIEFRETVYAPYPLHIVQQQVIIYSFLRTRKASSMRCTTPYLPPIVYKEHIDGPLH